MAEYDVDGAREVCVTFELSTVSKSARPCRATSMNTVKLTHAEIRL